VVWEYILGGTGAMKIIIPDMGHGNCIGLFEENSVPLLIDCGTKNSRKITNFNNLISHELKRAEKRDLIITHFHFDHHSLLRTFQPYFFDNIYLPRLPKNSSTAKAIFEFVAFAIVVHYQDYHLIPMISTRGKYIRPKVKGEQFNALNRDWDVLWPDYNIIDGENSRKIKKIFEVTNELKNKLNGEQAREFEKWYNVLSTAFSDIERSEIPPIDTARDRIMSADVQKSLESVEDIFIDLANRASLVVRDTPIRFLFTGDVDDRILNNHLIFGDHHYLLVEAPHHGGYYGTAFDNVSTQILVISRKESYKPRCEYFRDLPWNALVDTVRNGNCVIRC